MFSGDCDDKIRMTEAPIIAVAAESPAIPHIYGADSVSTNSLPFSVTVD